MVWIAIGLVGFFTLAVVLFTQRYGRLGRSPHLAATAARRAYL